MGKVVCVTGASGFIASWLVKLLLERGYTVKATVRNLSDPKKVSHLKALEGAKERLHLFQADVTEDGSFDSIVDGCEGVFHTASPVLFSVTDPQAELLEPAVRGTLNVLKSCSRVASIRRVVLTSSIAAVTLNRNYQGPDVVVDETWFSDPDFLKETQQWYMLSKTLAEEAAWKYAKENGIDLLVTNPALVIGPLLQPTINTSSQIILDFIKDVAYAHVLLFEDPLATGRYVLVATTLNRSELVQILNKLYPSLNLPNDGSANPTYEVCKKKAQNLGINFTPVEVSLKDTIDSLMEKDCLKL